MSLHLLSHKHSMFVHPQALLNLRSPIKTKALIRIIFQKQTSFKSPSVNSTNPSFSHSRPPTTNPSNSNQGYNSYSTCPARSNRIGKNRSQPNFVKSSNTPSSSIFTDLEHLNLLDLTKLLLQKLK